MWGAITVYLLITWSIGGIVSRKRYIQEYEKRTAQGRQHVLDRDDYVAGAVVAPVAVPVFLVYMGFAGIVKRMTPLVDRISNTTLINKISEVYDKLSKI
jgi:hypothetical protein